MIFFKKTCKPIIWKRLNFLNNQKLKNFLHFWSVISDVGDQTSNALSGQYSPIFLSVNSKKKAMNFQRRSYFCQLYIVITICGNQFGYNNLIISANSDLLCWYWNKKFSKFVNIRKSGPRYSSNGLSFKISKKMENPVIIFKLSEPLHASTSPPPCVYHTIQCRSTVPSLL